MLSTLQMLDVLNPPALKEMGNYLEDEWLNSENGPYTPYSQALPPMPTSSDPSPLSFGQASYLPPRTIPTSYAPATASFTYSAETSHPQAYEGLDLTPGFSALQSPAPGSTVSSPNVGPRPGLSDSRRGTGFNSPGNHLLLSQSPGLHTPPTAHMLPIHSQMPPTPQTAHLLPSQSISGPQSQGKSLKRPRADSDSHEGGGPSQRRRSRSASVGSRVQNDLSEEEQLLLKLKHEDSLPWKDIAREFETRLGRSYQVPALQMRYKRLRERLRTWTEDDIQALKAAHEFWEKSKFEIISQKMLEFGAAEKWPARLCERKWDEVRQSMPPTGRPEDGIDMPVISTASSAPTLSDLSKSSHDMTPMPFTPGWTFSRTISAPILNDPKMVEYAKATHNQV